MKMIFLIDERGWKLDDFSTEKEGRSWNSSFFIFRVEIRV